MDQPEAYQFRPAPGPNERHIKRRHRNVLFGDPAPVFTQQQVNQARADDRDLFSQFEHDFSGLLQQAMNLEGQAESDTVLSMKEQADKLYEQACRLGGDTESHKQGLKRLTSLIMSAVIKGAGDDPLAISELEDEGTARAAHYELLETALVTDLLDPESVIDADELAASVLSDTAEAAASAMNLFDTSQLAQLAADCEQLVAVMRQREGKIPPDAEVVNEVVQACAKQAQITPPIMPVTLTGKPSTLN